MNAGRNAPSDLSAVRYPMRPGRLTPLFSRPAPAPLDLTELAALQSLPLRARRLADAAGVGLHRSRRKGADVEFADYRSYQPGDDLRRIDWRLYGRTDRLQIRDSHGETPVRIQLVLDVSASMSYVSRPGLLTKLDHARALLAAIALIARRQRDPCGAALVADDLLRYTPPSGSPSRLRAVWGALEAPVLGQQTALATALAQLVEVSPHACLFVIASDFYERPVALSPIIRRLRFDRHDVLAMHIADPAEEDFPFTDAAEFGDIESGTRVQLDAAAAAAAYLSARTAHTQALAESFREVGFDYLALRTDKSPLAALAAYLARRSGRR